MHHDASFALGLLKANAALQLRLAQLLQERAVHWTELAGRASRGNIQACGKARESVEQATELPALAVLPSQAFWHQFQQGLQQAQASFQEAVQAQTTFNTGLHEALSQWQADTVAALRASGSEQPYALFMRGPWMQEAAPAGKAKAGARAA
ncbi:hypothetical protein V8Z80_20230 [Orrella sp. JC864]|uniref:hypothetical protein n=1 Tax=Orrella sp. JC864 TaxID=3120298 RepID=UPI0012BD4E55